MLHYGIESNEGGNQEDGADSKRWYHSEQTEDASGTARESIADLVRRFLREDTELSQRNSETQSAERSPQGHEQFSAETSGYEAFLKLRKDEVLFLNQKNEPVGQPQKFENFVDEKNNFVGDYKYSPGDEDESGILSDVPVKEWRDYVRNRLQVEYPDQEIHDDMNVIRVFQAAYESGDAELKQKISSGEIVSQDQIISYRIAQDFPGADGYDRVEYLQEHVTFRTELEAVPGVPGAEKEAVPEVVQEELRRLLPGLFAQESGFQEDVVNPQTHATGSGQFMPETWKRYTGTNEVSTDYGDQVAVLGPMVSDVYDRVLDKIGVDALQTLRSRFATEDDFLTSIITPAVISGFHTGPDRIAEAARRYVQSVQLNDMPAGKDLFLAIATYGAASSEGLLDGFKTESREYVTKVYAAANVLQEKYYQSDNQATLLAQN